LTSTFKFIDHTADIAVEVEADTIEELFTVSAEAWKKIVFEGAAILKKDEKRINIAEDDHGSLLVRFLNDLNFLFQAKKWVCSSIKEIIIKKNNEWNLSALLSGEPYNEKRHEVHLEIKAVTFHQMEIRKIKGKYSTRIVFDI
jgi:SHS2 domain-containing protein